MRVRTDSEAGRQPRHFMPLHKQNKQKDSKKRIPDSQQDILGLETKVPKTSSKNRSRSPLSSLSPLSPLGLTWLTGDGIGGQTCDHAVTQCPNPHRPSAGLPGFQGSGFKIPPGLEEFAMIMIIYANIYAISCFMPLLCNCHALSCWSLRCSLHCISVFQSVLPEVFGVHHKVSW